MAFGVISVDTSGLLGYNESESFVRKILQNGEDWEYPAPDTGCLADSYRRLEESMQARFDDALERFDDDNQTIRQKKEHRVEAFFKRTISSSEKALSTLIENRRSERVINATKTRIQREKERLSERMDSLKVKSKIDFTHADTAAGIVLVNGGKQRSDA